MQNGLHIKWGQLRALTRAPHSRTCLPLGICSVHYTLVVLIISTFSSHGNIPPKAVCTKKQRRQACKYSPKAKFSHTSPRSARGIAVARRYTKRFAHQVGAAKSFNPRTAFPYLPRARDNISAFLYCILIFCVL